MSWLHEPMTWGGFLLATFIIIPAGNVVLGVLGMWWKGVR